MDKRSTIANNETFLDILSNCQKNKIKVAMLLDDNGLVRAEGFITGLVLDTDSPFLELNGTLKILLKTITAVNGIFDPSYAEC